MKGIVFWVMVVGMSLFSFQALAQGLDLMENVPALSDFRVVGKIQPRHSREIRASNWSVGAEMMDRDFTYYKHWKDYLGKLGVKKARIQSGWAKTEKEKGVYDWRWLDEIIYDMVAQGVEPWVCLSYGNPIYKGGGGITLGGGIPSTEEAMEGWRNFVRAILKRYGNVVDEWEVWNEPNYHIDAGDYARYFVATAEIIRQMRPGATIIAFGIGSGVDYKYVDKVLTILKPMEKIHLIDQITHHRHIKIPEDRENEVELEKVVRKFSDKIVIRQGEAGCPSGISDYFAMKGYPWSEVTQAKHILRRLLTDLAYNKESSCFTIMDAKYPQAWNLKGLLKANQEDYTVEYPKPAYYALQHLTSVFDDQLVGIPGYPCQVETDDSVDIALYGYKGTTSKNQLVTLWKKGKTPSNETTISVCNLTFNKGKFIQPVLVDLVSGKVWLIPQKNWRKKGKKYIFKGIPVPDYPMLIADQSLLKIAGGL